MAQADNNTNTNSTKKETRKYTRGRDEVDLDAWLSNVSTGWGDFERSLIGRSYTDSGGKKKKITEKDLPGLRQSYNNLFRRLNSGDGSLIYNYDTAERGFRDTTGALNSDTNIYDGIVAKHFGNALRGMSVYSEPTVEDPNKIKYEDGAIGTALTRRLLGSAGTIQDFIDRDPYNRDTRTRGNTVRSRDFRELLRTTAADLRAGAGEFSDWTEDQRTNSANDLEGLFTIFDNDHQITDDEYLQLARTTGMSNLRKMFATGEQTAPTVVSPDGTQQRSGRTYADFIRWAGRRYRPFTGALIGPISLAIPDTERYGESTANSLSTAIQNASIQDLHSLLQRTIGRNNYNINDDDFIKRVFPSVNPGFSTQYVLGQVLNNLKGRSGGLHNFGENNLGTYFIPNTKTDRNTGFVWDSNANSISEMSIHNIPYWQARIRSEWDATDGNSEDDLDQSLVSAYPRFKEGGVLYAQAGAIMDRNRGRGPGFTGSNTWLAVPNTPENAYNIGTWDTYYNNAGIDQDIAQDNPNKFWDYGYRVDERGHPVRGEEGDLHGISAGQLGIYLNELNQLGSGLSWNKAVNARGYEAWNRKFDQTGLNMYFGGDSDKFNLMGPSTWNRHALLQRMQNTYNKDNPLKVGDRELYWNGQRWMMPLPNTKATLPGVTAVVPDPTIEVVNPLPTGPQNPDNPDESNVDETDTTGQNQSSGRGNNFLNMAMDFAPDLLGAGRLFASLRANNRITDILRPSLNPVLKDTYERYSPVTGAFSQMQFRNRQGAETLSQSYRPFTSDSSLAAARMLEGQRQANDLQAQGFLADDQEIKRTQEQALARQEDNMARRSEVANFNRASINQTNRERAQLEATRVNKNWRSWDNYLGGIEQRARQRADENRERRLSFAETVADDSARREYEELIKPASDALTAWTNSADGKDKAVTAWGDYDKYTRFMKEAANRYQASRLSGRAGVYGYRYDNPYAGENSEIPFSWASFRKNGGIIKPKQQDFIAQIIKLNNERNS